MNHKYVSNKWLNEDEWQQFYQQGFVVKTVLSEPAVAKYKSAIKNTSNSIELGAEKLANIQFIQQSHKIDGLQPFIAEQKIVEISQTLLCGGKAILDGASLLNAQPKTCYQQGWHRDILQLDEKEINDDWFSPEHFHNNVQINVALNEDECLWVIPQSHRRGFTEQEQAFFDGSKKMSPIDTDNLLNGVNVKLQPGQAVFYNNNLIHRGYCFSMGQQRLTVQLGFHSSLYPPTYHFGVLNLHNFAVDYLSTRDQKVQQSLLLHLSRRHHFPEVNKFHQTHQTFIKNEFFIPKTL